MIRVKIKNLMNKIHFHKSKIKNILIKFLLNRILQIRHLGMINKDNLWIQLNI